MDINTNFDTKNVAFLQQFLKDRGVVVSKLRKKELTQLCSQADKLHLQLDPDGLLDDRSLTIQSKLNVGGDVLCLPTLLESSTDFSRSPLVSSFDILHYLSKGKSPSEIRHFKKMEGYQMQRDGYVIDLGLCDFPTTNQYFALLAKVKPRTNAKDPVSGLPYYLSWIIVSKKDDDERIVSAYCCCKGGIDGFCRHVTAVLFEYLNFRSDNPDTSTSTSCTSLPCIWNRPSKWTSDQQVIESFDLDTSLTDESNTNRPHQRNVLATKPDPALFFDGIKEVLPGACCLDGAFVRSDEESTLNVPTPEQKLEEFLKTHQCLKSNCTCSAEFINLLKYTPLEIESIEKATKGQSSNKNWFAMRKCLITATKIKTICHSTDFEKTARRIQGSEALHDEIAPIQYGRTNEARAKKLFFQSHKLKHKSCILEEKGLCISHEFSFLGCSPDGVINCKACGPFLIEIKCLWKNRNFHPKLAGKMSGILVEEEGGRIVIAEKHAYNYQIQGQMGICGIHKAVLVIYTDKGIFSVSVPFSKHTWSSVVKQISYIL